MDGHTKKLFTETTKNATSTRFGKKRWLLLETMFLNTGDFNTMLIRK